MRRASQAIRTFVVTLVCPVLCLSSAVSSAQQRLPAPVVPAAPAPINSSSAAVQAYPPKPSVIEVLGSARRGFCAHMRASPICKLVSGLRYPLSTITGGLVDAEKAPHPDEQAQPGPEGTAAQIKKVQLQAPQRQAAVKAMEGLDVRYHPEAEATLIGALRADPSDCVRLQAAKTITTLPVCTKPLAEALQVCIAGTDVDGNPGELNDSVRLQANIASIRCQNCTPNLTEPADERPEYPNGPVAAVGSVVPVGATMPLNGYPPMVTPIPSSAPIAGGGTVPAAFSPPIAAAAQPTPSVPLPHAKKPSNLIEVFRAAAN